MNDVEGIKQEINLSKIGSDDIFIQFNVENPVFPDKWTEFTVDYLTKEHLSPDDRIEALSRIVDCLRRNIKEQVREWLLNEEKRMTLELESKHRIHYLEQTILRNVQKKAKLKT